MNHPRNSHGAAEAAAAGPVGARRGRGYSLIELVMSAAILAIVLLATQSAIVIAARSVPDGKSASSAMLLASQGLDRLASELRFATAINTSTANTLEFVVADVTGDGAADTVRYSWSGIAGAALLRTLNGGTAQAVASDVREFTLAYDKRTVALPVTYSYGSEYVVASNVGGLLNTNYTVDNERWHGQHFMPYVPSNAKAWKITRVKFMARANGSAQGTTTVQLRAPLAGLPGNAVLAQASMAESILNSSYQWIQWSLTNVSDLSPTVGICLLFTSSNSAAACDVQGQTFAFSDATNAYLDASGSGASWSSASSKQVIYVAYGCALIPDPMTYQYRLTHVHAALRTGTISSARVTSTLAVLNEPVVAGP